jgi:uncharacterized protein YgiB involved in biofilm formation
MSRVPSLAILAVVIALTGCKKQERCAAGDTPEVCKAVQECFASGTSIEICRMGEKDANQSRKDLAPAYNGAAGALNHDSSKAAQKPLPEQQKH